MKVGDSMRANTSIGSGFQSRLSLVNALSAVQSRGLSSASWRSKGKGLLLFSEMPAAFAGSTGIIGLCTLRFTRVCAFLARGKPLLAIIIIFSDPMQYTQLCYAWYTSFRDRPSAVAAALAYRITKGPGNGDDGRLRHLSSHWCGGIRHLLGRRHWHVTASRHQLVYHDEKADFLTVISCLAGGVSLLIARCQGREPASKNHF